MEMRWNYRLSANHLSKFTCIWNENFDVENLVWKAANIFIEVEGRKEREEKEKKGIINSSINDFLFITELPYFWKLFFPL